MIASPIPRFGLYGEPEHGSSDRLIHVETIASRSETSAWTIRVHSHAALHHLLIVRDGGGEMIVEGRARAFENAILVMPAGVAHGFRFAPGTIGHVVTIGGALLRAPGLGPVAEPLFDQARVLPGGNVDALRPIVDRLAQEAGSLAAHAALAGAALFQLLLVEIRRLLPAADDAPADPAPRRAAALVARYRGQLDRHVAGGWTVSDHARALGVSLARLRACCAEVAGVSPIRLLHDRRIAEARRQLAYTDRSVAEIAYDLGFDDPAYFSRFFRRCDGASPARWRSAVLATNLASG